MDFGAMLSRLRQNAVEQVQQEREGHPSTKRARRSYSSSRQGDYDPNDRGGGYGVGVGGGDGANNNPWLEECHAPMDGGDEEEAVEREMPTVAVRTVYIVCPARLQSGGPEAMHQLCDRLNTHSSIRNAYMLYVQPDGTPVRGGHATPPAYASCYNCPPAPNSTPADVATELVIYPECWTHLVDSYYYPNAQVAIWWLSVDNNKGRFRHFHRRDILHLYQSHYARRHLLSHLTDPSQLCAMTEYIRRQPPPGCNDGFRDRDVAYNPAKGMHYTDQIRKAIGQRIGLHPIGEGPGGRRRIGPEEVTALLLRSKVYIDFGPHPGMDRLPREAALCGCIVVTNGEGSAGFQEDVPIPEEYRIRSFCPDKVHSLLRKCVDEYQERRSHFDEYREWIAGQFDRMDECVKVLLKKIVDDRRQPPQHVHPHGHPNPHISHSARDGDGTDPLAGGSGGGGVVVDIGNALRENGARLHRDEVDEEERSYGQKPERRRRRHDDDHSSLGSDRGHGDDDDDAWNMTSGPLDK